MLFRSRRVRGRVGPRAVAADTVDVVAWPLRCSLHSRSAARHVDAGALRHVRRGCIHRAADERDCCRGLRRMGAREGTARASRLSSWAGCSWPCRSARRPRELRTRLAAVLLRQSARCGSELGLLETAAMYVVSPSRGLLVYDPIVIVAGIGVWLLVRRRAFTALHLRDLRHRGRPVSHQSRGTAAPVANSTVRAS